MQPQNPTSPTLPTPDATVQSVPTIAPTATELPVVVATATPTPVVVSLSIEDVKAIASNSSCAKYSWKERGRPAKGYIPGVALVFARAVCNQQSPMSQLISKPATTDTVRDVMAHYSTIFSDLKMENNGGPDTLRHAFMVLLGLGMRESSGRYCCGRDMSANYSTADSAEAGLFQTSWGSRRSSPLFTELYNKYKANPVGCFLGTFGENVSCSESNLQNWGEGEGFTWQKLTKECPAFATEWAAMLIRVSGGTKGEFGPLRKQAAEVRPECNAMFKQIQDLVTKDGNFCTLINNHK